MEVNRDYIIFGPTRPGEGDLHSLRIEGVLEAGVKVKDEVKLAADPHRVQVMAPGWV